MLAFALTPLCRQHMDRNGYTEHDMLGTIPAMLSADDPAGAVEQIDRAYKDIGGGWSDVAGFALDLRLRTLTYPGDPARLLLAEAKLRAERILFFNGAWIAVAQPDGSFRVARID